MANKWKVLAWNPKDGKWEIVRNNVNSESEAERMAKNERQATGRKVKFEKY